MNVKGYFGDMEHMILELIAKEPSLSQADAARRLGISRQRVSQLCKQHGLKLAKGTKGIRKDSKARTGPNPNHFGHPRGRSNSAFIGAASEAVVAAYLMQRGIPVYRSMSPVASCDLIADFDGALFKIEVRSAKRDKSGRLVFGLPQERYDLIALVPPDGLVEFRARPGIAVPDWESPKPK